MYRSVHPMFGGRASAVPESRCAYGHRSRGLGGGIEFRKCEGGIEDFVTFDRRLHEAADREGFHVLPES